jgi:hypothetical protein
MTITGTTEKGTNEVRLVKVPGKPPMYIKVKIQHDNHRYICIYIFMGYLYFYGKFIFFMGYLYDTRWRQGSLK